MAWHAVSETIGTLACNRSGEGLYPFVSVLPQPTMVAMLPACQEGAHAVVGGELLPLGLRILLQLQERHVVDELIVDDLELLVDMGLDDAERPAALVLIAALVGRDPFQRPEAAALLVEDAMRGGEQPAPVDDRGAARGCPRQAAADLNVDGALPVPGLRGHALDHPRAFVLAVRLRGQRPQLQLRLVEALRLRRGRQLRLRGLGVLLNAVRRRIEAHVEPLDVHEAVLADDILGTNGGRHAGDADPQPENRQQRPPTDMLRCHDASLLPTRSSPAYSGRPSRCCA